MKRAPLGSRRRLARLTPMHHPKLLLCSGMLLLLAASSGCTSPRRKPVVGSVPPESSFRSADGSDDDAALPGPHTAVMPGSEVAPGAAGDGTPVVVGDPRPQTEGTEETTDETLADAEAEPPPDDPWGPNKTPMGLEIRNTCRTPVQIFLGPEPPDAFHSPIILAGYGSIHMSVLPGGTVWLLDAARQPLASATFDAQSPVLRIDPSCQQFQVP